ncbi:MAG: hypothetical protein JNK05_13465 [Myxococcales bacterium]|nr:hypothetical protein [Myxococcales bacterium]
MAKLKARINHAAKLMNEAMPRARGSWRTTIEDMVRQDVRDPRSPKHSLDAMPSAQLERALVVADQRVHEAERVTRSVR